MTVHVAQAFRNHGRVFFPLHSSEDAMLVQSHVKIQSGMCSSAQKLSRDAVKAMNVTMNLSDGRSWGYFIVVALLDAVVLISRGWDSSREAMLKAFAYLNHL